MSFSSAYHFLCLISNVLHFILWRALLPQKKSWLQRLKVLKTFPNLSPFFLINAIFCRLSALSLYSSMPNSVMKLQVFCHIQCNFFGHTLQFYYFQFYYLGINEDDAKLSLLSELHCIWQIYWRLLDQVPNSVMKLHKYTFFNSDSNKTIVYHFLCLISNVLHFILQNKIVSLFPIEFEAWQIRIPSQLEKEKQQQNSLKGNT